MSKELFHQSMKNSRALETRDNTWEGQETSETWLQKCLNTRQVFRSFFLPGVPVCHRCLSRWGKNTSSLLNFVNRHCCLKGNIIIQHKKHGNGKMCYSTAIPVQTISKLFSASTEEDAVVMPGRKVIGNILLLFCVTWFLCLILRWSLPEYIKCSEDFVKDSVRKPKKEIYRCK